MTRVNSLESYGPVAVLMALISFLYLVFMIALIPPLAQTDLDYPVNTLYPNSDIVNISVVNVLLMITLICFIRASFTSPGSVPEVFPWDQYCPPSFGASPELEAALEVKGYRMVRGVERKKDGRARFCDICKRFKPDRAHHSRRNGECVLEMDHYCPWIRNCVGYFNKKFFFLLILYGAMTLVGYCVALGPRFLYACRNMTTGLDFFIAVGWILALLLSLLFTVFLFFHIYLMSKAYTTIEFCEKRQADQDVRNVHGFQVKQLYESSPFDQGLYRNICHVLGPWYLWLIPTRFGMPSDVSAGCLYDVVNDHPIFKSALITDNSLNAAAGTDKQQTQPPQDGSGSDSDSSGQSFTEEVRFHH